MFIVSCGGGGSDDPSSADNISLNPIINFLRVNNTTINSGSYITLSWQSTMAISCSATGDWDGIKTRTGTESLQLDEVRTHTFVLICDGEAGQKSTPSTVSVIVAPVQTNIYSEDKDSYCASPSNSDESNYWIEEFNNPIFNDNYFTYQKGNGFSAPNGQWIGGWGNNEIQYYLDTSTTPYFTIIKDQTTEFSYQHWPFNENFYLIINVALGGNGAGGSTPDITNFCLNKDCSNLTNKDDGRLLIDFIEVKSID